MPWIELERSIKHNQVRRFIPEELASFQHTFKTEDILSNENFWLQVSKIINVPYEDMPLDNSMCSYLEQQTGTYVYRFNHDVAHGIRKLLYSHILLNLLPQHLEGDIRTSIQSMDILHTNLFYLLIFLERAGRTNEYSSSDDHTIYRRTWEIFKYISTHLLRCSDDRVERFRDVLMKGPKQPHTSGLFMSSSKSNFYQDLFLHHCLISVHHLDLLRCRSTEDVRHWFLEDIRTMIPSRHSLVQESISQSLVQFAEYSLFHTGTRYDPKSGQILSDSEKDKVLCILYPGSVVNRLRGQWLAIRDVVPQKVGPYVPTA